MSKYVLDASAVVAYLDKEPGHGQMVDLLEKAGSGRANLFIASVNLINIIYRRLALSAECGNNISHSGSYVRTFDIATPKSCGTFYLYPVRIEIQNIRTHSLQLFGPAQSAFIYSFMYDSLSFCLC